jgi:hypothetical protein
MGRKKVCMSMVRRAVLGVVVGVGVGVGVVGGGYGCGLGYSGLELRI